MLYIQTYWYSNHSINGECSTSELNYQTSNIHDTGSKSKSTIMVITHSNYDINTSRECMGIIIKADHHSYSEARKHHDSKTDLKIDSKELIGTDPKKISNDSMSNGGSNGSRTKSYRSRTKLERRKKQHRSKLKWNPILLFSDNTIKLDRNVPKKIQSGPEESDLDQSTAIRKFRGIPVATEYKKSRSRYSHAMIGSFESNPRLLESNPSSMESNPSPMETNSKQDQMLVSAAY